MARLSGDYFTSILDLYKTKNSTVILTIKLIQKMEKSVSRRESKHKKAVKARVVLAGNLTSFLNPKNKLFPICYVWVTWYRSSLDERNEMAFRKRLSCCHCHANVCIQSSVKLSTWQQHKGEKRRKNRLRHKWGADSLNLSFLSSR